MNCFSEEQTSKISRLIREIERLSDVEKLLLYLQLPCGRVDNAEGKSKYNNGSGRNANDLFSRKPDQETTHTYTWILSHLEVDANVSLPKQEVYDEYKAFCQASRFEPLCVADFGKAMKHAFPCIKPRRLGQRGNSRYCYSGLKKRYKLPEPSLPELIEPTFCMDHDCSQAYNQIIRGCQENPEECPLNMRPLNITGFEAIDLKMESNNGHARNYHSGGSTSSMNETSTSSSLLPLGCQSHEMSPASDVRSRAGSHHSMIVQHIPTSMAATYSELGICTSSAGSTLTTHSFMPTSSYDYARVIKQPGSPDDDEYKHYYQDLQPIQSELLVANTSQSNTTTMPTTSGFMYQQQQQQQSSLATKEPQQHLHHHHQTSGNGHNLGDEDRLASSGERCAQNGDTFAALNNQEPQAQLMMSMISSPYIEACASPFQSPTPTPYPMSSYLNGDIPDYYSTDCISYPNT